MPIWLAGNQRHLTRLAGELCEGSIDHPIHGTKWVLTRGRDALAAGLRAAGRDRKDIHWNAFLWVAVNPDRTEALDDARRPSRSTRVCGSTSRCSPRWGSEGGAGLLGGVGAQGHGRLDRRRQRRHGGDVRGPGRRQRLPPDKIMLYAGGIAETFYS